MTKNALSAAVLYCRLGNGTSRRRIFAQNVNKKSHYGGLNVVCEPIKCQFCGQLLSDTHGSGKFETYDDCGTAYVMVIWEAICEDCGVVFRLAGSKLRDEDE